MNLKDGAVAQLVEQRTENPCVPGSSPGGATSPQRKLGAFLLCKYFSFKKILIFIPNKKTNYEKNSISSSHHAYLHDEFRTGNTALLLNARL